MASGKCDNIKGRRDKGERWRRKRKSWLVIIDKEEHVVLKSTNFLVITDQTFGVIVHGHVFSV